MGFAELFILAVGLSMDAFAVAVCKGLASKKVTVANMITVGVWFGVFQAVMPLLGYLLGSAFESYITGLDHWVVFALLTFLGVKMLWGAAKGDEEQSASFGVKTMLLLALATSIDALAVGITFALFPDINIAAAIAFIGAITFLLSAAGVKIGEISGGKLKRVAVIVGGCILILMGTKILLEHLGVF